jgi:RHS repeat-associated protein
MLAEGQPAPPILPLAALPSRSIPTSTTALFPAGNRTMGLSGTVPIWEPGFLVRNHHNPLGLPVSLYDSGRRSRCTGKERDNETGLDYFGARYMSAAQGRFTSPDAPLADQHAADPQSWNLYSYVRNNPLRHIDSDGRTMLDINPMVNFTNGVFKGWVNAHLSDQGSVTGAVMRKLGVQQQTASNSGQAAGMRAFPAVETAIGVAAVFVGPKGAKVKTEGPGFVVSRGGDVIPVPEGASGPNPVVNPQGKTTGFSYTEGSGGPGLDPRVSDVRVMDPTAPRGNSPGYPDGYVTYQNASGQGVDPQTGRTVPNSDPSRHIPLSPPPPSPAPKPPCAGGTTCVP